MSIPRRINIMGASGSGTTTLGRALAKRTGWNLFDADDYYWLASDPPFQKKRPAPERLKMLLDDMSCCEGTVVSGSVVGWGEALEGRFDLVVFLLIPPQLRMERLLHREVELFGRANPNFMQWAALYDTGDMTVRSRALHEAWLSKRQCPVLRLEGDLTTEHQIDAVLAHFS